MQSRMLGSRLSVALLGALLWVLLPRFAFAQEVDCLTCHGTLKAAPVVHAAIEMGCPSCHSAIDASQVPHKKTSEIAKGLSADQPDLCYGCHDKSAFEKKNVHAAVAMGCTGCHNPHSSKNAKLLLLATPDLCFSCHDKKPFEQKTVHAPVIGGMCLSCHTPHASDEMALLAKKPGEVCLECHSEVLKGPHVSAGGHPVTTERPRRGRKAQEPPQERKDPARPGKVFYCGSCHDPHSTQVARLLRYNARSSMSLCQNCHKY